MKKRKQTNTCESVRDTAILWVIEFDAGHVTAEGQRRFSDWLQSDRNHEQAFYALLHNWRWLDFLHRSRPEGYNPTTAVDRWLNSLNQ